MATIIHFIGRDQLMVREDEGAVRDAFHHSAGGPIELTHHRSGGAVFVNPTQITYWQGRGSRSTAERNRSERFGVPTFG